MTYSTMRLEKLVKPVRRYLRVNRRTVYDFKAWYMVVDQSGKHYFGTRFDAIHYMNSKLAA